MTWHYMTTSKCEAHALSISTPWTKAELASECKRERLHEWTVSSPIYAYIEVFARTTQAAKVSAHGCSLRTPKWTRLISQSRIVLLDSHLELVIRVPKRSKFIKD